MKKIKIVADSASDLKFLDGIAFETAPLKIITSEKEYVDIPELDVELMVNDLLSYKGKSSTSCPNVADWLEVFGDADWIFCTTITGTLSGSFNSANSAKRIYEQEHPGCKVLVINSLSTGPEMILIIEKLRELLKTEFVEVEGRIANGLLPLAFYGGEGSSVVYRIGESASLQLVKANGECGLTEVKIEECEGGYTVSLYVKDIADDYIVIKLEPRIFHPIAPICLSGSGASFASSKRSFFTFANSYKAFSIHPDDVERELGGYNISVNEIGEGDLLFTLYIGRERFGMAKTEPFRLDIERFGVGEHYDLGCASAKEAIAFSDKVITRLVHGTFSPECYALIIPGATGTK